jgi:hypothetical protein
MDLSHLEILKHTEKNFYFFGGIWVLTQGFMVAKQALCCLSHTCSPFCSGYFGDGGLMNYLPGLASNHHSPNLSLPSN